MKEYKEKLAKLCIEGMMRFDIFHEKGRNRLKLELKNISDLEEEKYFLELVDKKVKFARKIITWNNDLIFPFSIFTIPQSITKNIFL